MRYLDHLAALNSVVEFQTYRGTVCPASLIIGGGPELHWGQLKGDTHGHVVHLKDLKVDLRLISGQRLDPPRRSPGWKPDTCGRGLIFEKD